MKNSLFSVLCALLCITGAHAQVYVTPSGAGAHDGTSWSNAYQASDLWNLMAASPAGTQVWVSAGTYKPAVNSRDSGYVLTSGVQVYGGFAGTETTLAARDWATNLTILSGDVGLPGVDTDNVRHVVRIDMVDSSTILDGFIIEHGYATLDTTYEMINSYGGGIANWSESFPVIRNCTMQYNYSERSGAGLAAVNTTGQSHGHIINCRFLHNYSADTVGDGGGALAIYAASLMFIPGDTTDVYTLIDSCEIAYNNKNGLSVIGNDANASPVIKRCYIHDNGACGIKLMAEQQYSGAGLNVHLDSCHIKKNMAHNYGAGILAWAFRAWKNHISISNCTIDSNEGGVQFVLDTTKNTDLRVSNTRFDNNSLGGWGGTDAIYLQTGSGTRDSLRISNCVFNNTLNNYVGSLADVEVEDMRVNGHPYVEVNNCTFFKQLPPASYLSSFIEAHTYTATATTNSINIAVNNSIFYCPDTSYFAPVSALGPIGTVSVRYKNNILANDYSSTGTWTGLGTDLGGNIDAYPYFRDTVHGDLRLTCLSPAFNAGANSAVPSYLTTDITGVPRIKYGTVDMGAYEADSSMFTGPNAWPVKLGHAHIDTFISLDATADSVRWDFGDGTHSNQDTVVHNYTTNGTYHVCLHTYGPCGVNDSCFNVTVSHTGVAGLQNAGLRLYPNPATRELFIEHASLGTMITLSDLAGRVMCVKRMEQASERLDMDRVSPGYYLLQTTDEQGNRNVYPIIKQ
jgi:hypothetical protein